MEAIVTFDSLVSDRSLSPWRRHQFHHVKVSHHMDMKSAVTQSPAPPMAVSACYWDGAGPLPVVRLAGWLSVFVAAGIRLV